MEGCTIGLGCWEWEMSAKRGGLHSTLRGWSLVQLLFLGGVEDRRGEKLTLACRGIPREHSSARAMYPFATDWADRESDGKQQTRRSVEAGVEHVG